MEYLSSGTDEKIAQVFWSSSVFLIFLTADLFEKRNIFLLHFYLSEVNLKSFLFHYFATVEHMCLAKYFLLVSLCQSKTIIFFSNSIDFRRKSMHMQLELFQEYKRWRLISSQTHPMNHSDLHEPPEDTLGRFPSRNGTEVQQGTNSSLLLH